MKVLQINVVYRTGSTGKIMFDIHGELLKRGFESLVCYSRSTKPLTDYEHRLCGRIYSRFNALISSFTGHMFGGCFFSTNKCISIIKKEKPDIVHLHCLNGNFINIYRLITFLNERKIKTVLTLHAEFMFTGGCGYTLTCKKWKENYCKQCPRFKQESHSLFFDKMHNNLSKMKMVFDQFNNLVVVGVSDWILNQAKESIVFKDKKFIRIHNGIDINLFYPADESSVLRIKKKYSIPSDKKIVLTVNPRFDDYIKGGDIFVELVNKLPDNYFSIIVGTNKTINSSTLSIPYTENQKELSVLYSCADVFVMCSRSDNYPTVCLEANCCGTPVVAFDVGGIKETIGENMGDVVDPYDKDMFIQKAIFWSNRMIDPLTISKRRDYCSKFRMVDDYCFLYKSLLDC